MRKTINPKKPTEKNESGWDDVFDEKMMNPSKQFDRCGLQMSKKLMIKSEKNTDKEVETDEMAFRCSTVPDYEVPAK